jgi:deoxyribonuclease V
VIVDGFVWLGDESRPGLGAHLFEALSSRSAVIGVAKTCFRGAGPMREVFRGGSERPLLVSAVGLGLDEAAARVEQMHGAYRIPTLLKAVDRLCRTDRPDETDGIR